MSTVKFRNHRFATFLLCGFAATLITVTATAQEKGKPLTNSEVVKMLENKIPESVIISKIQTSEVKFDTSTDAIIELNKKGVSEKILNAMLKPKTDSGEIAKSSDASTPTPAAPAEVKTTNLTYGATKGLVKKGVTTQSELLELFGGPDVMTTDKDGTEVWMYDKSTSTVSGSQASSSTQADKSQASVMAGFLGIPFIAGVGGGKASTQSQGTQETQGTNTVTRSSKTITFIIKFNQDKTVKDYAVRQSKY